MMYTLKRPHRRQVLRVIQYLAHVVDAGIRRGVELDQVDKAPGINLRTRRAHAARRRRDAGFAIQALGEDARHRSLADAARAGKQIGMVQAVLRQRIGQRLHHMRLAFEIRK